MEKSSTCIIGIDIGTGSCKAVAVSPDGRVLAQTKQFYGTLTTEPEYAEQDPETIWQAFQQCFHEVIPKLPAPAAICLSSAMHSVMAISGKNETLTPLIIWADKRSKDIATALRASARGKEVYEATGTPVHSMTPLCKLMWFAKNRKDVHAKAAKWIGIKEFIWFRLFHEYQIDESVASATGLFNIHSRSWNKDSLELAGITENHLSAISKTSFVRRDADPEIASSLGIPTDTPFYIGASDGCLANLGSHAVKAGSAALTIGTSGAVRIAHSKPVSDYESMLFSYVLDDSTFICGGPVNNGGVIVPWLFKTFLGIKEPASQDYEKLFARIDQIPPGSDGLVFVPYLLGERAPVWDAGVTGSFHGIKYTHTTSHFLRAGIEGICYALNSIIEILESSSECIANLSISGGFVKSQVWTQILADITQKQLHLYQIHDASCLGATILAARNLYKEEGYQPAGGKNCSTITPDRQTAKVYGDQMEIFRSLIKPK